MVEEKISLKRATPADFDNIIAIERSVDGIKIYSALTDKKELTEEVTNNFFYVIEKNGKIVGDVSYEIKGRDSVYLSGLVVAPKFQGQGIAKKVMSTILEKLKDIKLIDLVTHPENEKAISLYESFGFKKTGEQIENYYGDGEPRIRMVLKR